MYFMLSKTVSSVGLLNRLLQSVLIPITLWGFINYDNNSVLLQITSILKWKWNASLQNSLNLSLNWKQPSNTLQLIVKTWFVWNQVFAPLSPSSPYQGSCAYFSRAALCSVSFFGNHKTSSVVSSQLCIHTIQFLKYCNMGYVMKNLDFSDYCKCKRLSKWKFWLPGDLAERFRESHTDEKAVDYKREFWQRITVF